VLELVVVVSVMAASSILRYQMVYQTARRVKLQPPNRF
jgi:hypothetical protein